MDYRTEKDTLGEVRVPADRYWGAQTQRSLENFRIGGQRMPTEIIRAFAVLKKAAARTNAELTDLPADKVDAIEKHLRQWPSPVSCIGFAVDEIWRTQSKAQRKGSYARRYPLIEYGVDEAEPPAVSERLGLVEIGRAHV